MTEEEAQSLFSQAADVLSKGEAARRESPLEKSPLEQGSFQVVPQAFIFEGARIQTLVDGKGDPWFVAKDVCTPLGYTNSRKAVADHCKHAKLLKSNDSLQLTTSPYGVTIIPESDLYRLILRSKMPQAEKFQAWVTEEVLPQIRKTGGYIPATPDGYKQNESFGLTNSPRTKHTIPRSKVCH